MFKCKLLSEEREKQVKVYVAGRARKSTKKKSLKKLNVKRSSKRITLGWYYTGDARILNHLLML